MLIVDINALQTINLLNLLDQVVLNSVYALDLQDVMRIDRTFCQLVARFDHIPIHYL